MNTAPAVAADAGKRAVHRGTFDLESIRGDFPILSTRVRGKPLVYLDNAASSQKPRAVIDRINRFHREEYANVHRGVHRLSEKATLAFEGARETVRAFLGASSTDEVVFVRGATEGINLVAESFARPLLQVGDEVLITEMEHHSNIVPWQMVCERTGARLRIAPITDRGEVDLEAYRALLSERTRLVAFTHVSNALGTINPVRQMADLARSHGASVVVDGAQSVAHLPVDVQALGCDFFIFSAHKAYGPTGIGVLWGRRELLAAMPPYQGGGEMIRSVSFEKTEYAEPPHRFEAGTPHISGALGLETALEYLSGVGMEAVARHDREIAASAADALSNIDGVRLVGTAPEKTGVVSFVVDGVHPHDVGTILDSEGIAIRAGHHCAQPLMKRYGVSATARASFGLYNTQEEVEALALAVGKAKEILR